MSRPSKRFTPSRWSEILVPVFLFLLSLALLGVLVVIGLSVIGLTPN